MSDRLSAKQPISGDNIEYAISLTQLAKEHMLNNRGGPIDPRVLQRQSRDLSLGYVLEIECYQK